MDWRLVPKKKPWDGAQTRENQLRADAIKRLDQGVADKAKARDLFAKKAAADVELQRMKNKKVINVPRNAPGNPHDQFIADLIKGLQDGSIVLRSVDARRVSTHPYTELLVELLDIGPQPGLKHGHPGVTGATGAVGPTGTTGAAPGYVPPAAAVTPVGGIVGAARAMTSSMTAMTSAMGGPVAGSGPSMIQKVAALPGATTYGLKQSKSIEPIVGYRDFKLVQGQQGYSLQSRNGAIWPHRRKMEGLCNGNPFVDHDVPEPQCSCGIYAYAKPDDKAMQRDNASLWGEIAMWGEVLVCETGYRSEFAYPTALFMRKPGMKKPSRTLERAREELEDSYGVPVFILSEREGKTASEIMQEILQKQLGEILNNAEEEA